MKILNFRLASLLSLQSDHSVANRCIAEPRKRIKAAGLCYRTRKTLGPFDMSACPDVRKIKNAMLIERLRCNS